MTLFLTKLLSISLLILIPCTAQSHAIWFAERVDQLAIVYGEGADDLDVIKRQHKIKSIKGFDENWQPQATSLSQQGPLLVIPSQTNIAAVSAVLNNGVWSNTLDGKWLAKGRDEVPNARLSERTMKYAVHLTGPLRTIPQLADQKLQLITTGDHFPSLSGEQITLQVIYAGKAVAGARVITDFVNQPDEAPVLSDQQGFVKIAIRNQGLNVIAATYDSAPDQPKIIDKIEHLATLSFVLDHQPE